MKNLLTTKEIENFKADGAVVLRKKFDISWIKKLKLEDLGYNCKDLESQTASRIDKIK